MIISLSEVLEELGSWPGGTIIELRGERVDGIGTGQGFYFKVTLDDLRAMEKPEKPASFIETERSIIQAASALSPEQALGIELAIRIMGNMEAPNG